MLVEGKLGWWRFLLVYLGMGIGQCMFEQMVVPASVGPGSAGASNVIFGLMAMSLVWAPMNEMSCILILWVHPFFFDLTVLVFSVIMGTLRCLTAVLSGMSYGSVLDWRLPEPVFRQMIVGYHRAKQFSESIPVMVEYLRTYTDEAPRARLKLAEILIRHQRQPAQARAVLAKIPAGALDASGEAYRRKLEQWANRCQVGDVIELKPENW